MLTASPLVPAVQVVEQCAMEVWDSGRLDISTSLQVARVPACARGFFQKMGFTWQDPPLNTEGHKLVMPPQPECNCGACAGGALSRRMNLKLLYCASQQQYRFEP
jgi:hypothetical protein